MDTQNKRRSVLGLLPVPDSDISKADREAAIGLYCGITPLTARYFSGAATGVLTANLALSVLNRVDMSGAASGSLSGSLALTFGAVEMFSGVAAASLAASMAFTFIVGVSGRSNIAVSTRGRIVTETKNDGMIARY